MLTCPDSQPEANRGLRAADRFRLDSNAEQQFHSARRQQAVSVEPVSAPERLMAIA